MVVSQPRGMMRYVALLQFLERDLESVMWYVELRFFFSCNIVVISKRKSLNRQHLHIYELYKNRNIKLFKIICYLFWL